MGMMFARRRSEEKKAMRDKEKIADSHNEAHHKKVKESKQPPKEVKQPLKEAVQDGSDKRREKQDSPAPRLRG